MAQELNDFGFGEFAGGGGEHAGGSGGEDFAFGVEDEDDGDAVFELGGVPGAEKGDVLTADGEVERNEMLSHRIRDGGVGGHEEEESLAGGAAGFADLDVEVFFFGFGGLEGCGVACAGVDFRGVGDFVLGEGE